MEDVGSYTRDGIKAIHKWGICSERIWPYLIDKFALPPSLDAYLDATKRIVNTYYRLITLDDMLRALDIGYPIVTSMNVYNTFYELEIPGKTTLKMPANADNIIGGHAVVLVGYNLANRVFITRNSFGELWGDKGYFYTPFDYVEKDFMDNWIFDIDVACNI